MRLAIRFPRPDDTLCAAVRQCYDSSIPPFRRLLNAEAAGAAPAGGAAPAAGTTPTPTTAPAAAGGEPGGAAKALADLAPLVDGGDGKEASAAVTADDQRKFLVEKGGKADELAKLSEAELKTKYDEAKTADGQEAKPGEITITVPEGIEIDEKTLGDFKAILSDDKMKPSDRAQKLIEMHASALKAVSEAPLNLWYDTQVKWQGEVKADKELGGANLDANRAAMAKAISGVMGDKAAETFEALKYTGAANHPAIVRLLSRVSNLLVEGDLVSGAAPRAAKSKGFASAVAAMYPSASGSQAG